MSGNFDKTLVEAEVVSDGVLPSLLVVPVIGKVLHDELIDSVQSETFLRRPSNCHHDQGIVTEWRLLWLLLLFISCILLSIFLSCVLFLSITVTIIVIFMRTVGRI